MMSRIILALVFVAGLYYLYAKKTPPPAPPLPPPAPPAALGAPPPQVISEAELARIRAATNDSDPQVRWAAIDLLYRVGDPQAMEILEKTLKMDTESRVRQNALEILRQKSSAKDILPALNDSDKEIRKAALIALGEVADPASAPDILRALNDIEPDVRAQALQAIGRIQEKKMLQYRDEQTAAKHLYEEALRKYKAQPSENSLDKNDLGATINKIGR